MNIYIINMPSEQGRAAFQRRQFTRLKLGFTRVDAVTIEDISSDFYQQVAHSWERPLSYPEVACYMSHRKIWQKILEEERPALVLEDDAYVCDDLPMLLDQLSKIEVDYVNMETRGRKKILAARVERTIGSYNLRRLYYGGTGAAAYVLWPSGAAKLLQKERQQGIALADAQICRTSMTSAWQLDAAAAIQLDCCELYGIASPYQTNSSLSGTRLSVPTVEANRRAFKNRRLKSQINLAGKKLFALCRGARREEILPMTKRFNQHALPI
jgi:glycosyl transferase family 25